MSKVVQIIIELLVVLWIGLAIFSLRGVAMNEWKEWFLAKLGRYPPLRVMLIEILTVIAMGWIMFELLLSLK